MSTSFQTPSCPYCGTPARLGTRPARAKRGDRVVEVEFQHWECPAGCLAEEEDTPFRFVDAQLGRANQQAAEEAWLRRFGEPMPPARRPGRKTAEKRTEQVPLLLSPGELATIDQARGGLSRNEFIRQAALRQAKAS